MDNSELSVIDQTRRDNLESVIERGIHSFIEVGAALAEIREGRLYRESHSTFEEYCRERWGMDKRNANRYIEAANISETLGSIDPTLPTPDNVGQARELVPVKDNPESLRDVVLAAAEKSKVDGQPLTAKRLRESVREHISGMAAESRAELAEATEHWTPEMRESVSPEMMRQRGELRRLITSITKLPDPGEYWQRHGDQFDDSFFHNVDLAVGWLKSFTKPRHTSEEK